MITKENKLEHVIINNCIEIINNNSGSNLLADQRNEIQYLKKEIEYLKEINELLKNNNLKQK